MVSRTLLKKAYKLRYGIGCKCHSILEVHRILRETYKNVPSRAFFEKIFVGKINKEDVFLINFRCRFYRDSTNIKKALDYFNEKYNTKITKAALTVFCSRRGVFRNNVDSTNIRKFSKETERQIVNEYLSGIDRAKLANKYGFKTSKSIYDMVKRYGYKTRNNEEYLKSIGKYDFSLDIIDSVGKAYYVGMLLTDGSVYDTDRSSGLQLNSTDEDAIEYISSIIDRKYYSYKGASGSISTSNRKLIYRVNLHGDRYVKQAERIGIVRNKSKIIPAPKLFSVEEEYIPEIIQGVIDGDGWIRRDGREFFICGASYDFMFWCKTQLEKLGMINLKVKEYISKGNLGECQMFQVRSAIRYNMNILLNSVYKNNVGMQRKYNNLKNVQRL